MPLDPTRPVAANAVVPPATNVPDGALRTLDQLPMGATATVVEVLGDDQALRRRLLEMGFCNQATVTTVRVAPLGDPLEVKLRGYHLSLRQAEAARLRVRIAR